MKQMVVKCRECKTELGRSDPYPEDKSLSVGLGAVLCNFRCPNNCRATYSDCNMNIETEEIEYEETPCDKSR